MLITLDKMAVRYNQLPSDLLSNATTFDLYVMDIGVRYEIVSEQKRNGTYVKPLPELSQQEMMDLIRKVNG
jgi:hypothetical protein